MMWMLTRLVVWPMKLGFQTGRLVGYRRIFVFGLGVVAGLLLAPTTGAALRARIRAVVDDVSNDPVPAESPVGRDHVVDLTAGGA